MREDYIGSWFYEGRVSTREKIMKTGAHALGEERKLIDEMAQEYRVKIDFN
jgi:hypothetical protein